ncbi:hypothetical protein KC354_g6765 [Hortaea werneckii]|nr:hypothetical protein KC354_g6765 [Hortaea werneckii]
MAPTRAAAAVGSPSRRSKVEQQRSLREATDPDPSSKLPDSHPKDSETIDLVRCAETESITVSHSFLGIPSAKPIRRINTPKPEAFSTRVLQQSSRVSKPKVDSKTSSPQQRGIHFSSHPETQKQLSELYTGIMGTPESGETSAPAHQEATAEESPERTPARKRAREDDEWAEGGTTPTKKTLTDHPSAATVPKGPEAGSKSPSKEKFTEKRRRGQEQYLQAVIDQLRREKEEAEQRARKAEEKEDWLKVKLEESKRLNREAGKAKTEHEQRGIELTNVKVRCATLSDAVDELRAEKVKLKEEKDKLRDEKEKLETTNRQQTNELETAQKKVSELKSKLGSANETISKMKKHFETFKTGSGRAMKKVKSKARLITKRICGMRGELETEKKSRDDTMGIALTYRDAGAQAMADRSQALADRSQALADRAQLRQEIDLRNSFDQEMGEMGESQPEPAAKATSISTGTFGLPSFLPQADSPMSDAAAVAPTSTPISTGTFGRPSYPPQVDTPMSDAATKQTGHNNNNSNHHYYSNFKRNLKRRLKRTNGSRQSCFHSKKFANKQQNRVSRLPKQDIAMPDASKHTPDPNSRLSSTMASPPPTGSRWGGCFGGRGAGQQQSQANTQSAQGDVAMTDDNVKTNVDHTDGGCFGFPPPKAPTGPRSAGQGDGREQRLPPSSKPCALDTTMADATEPSSQKNNTPGSMPPSGPGVSEFGRRSGKEAVEKNRSPRAAELDRAMPNATESGSHGNGSQLGSGTSGQAPQLEVGSRRMEATRRIDNNTKKLDQRVGNTNTAKQTTLSAERRWNRYRT